MVFTEFLERHSLQHPCCILVLVRSGNSLEQQNLSRSIQTRSNFYSPLLELLSSPSVLLKPSKLKLTSMALDRSQDPSLTLVLDLSELLEILPIVQLSTTLDLVTSSILVDLQRQLPSIQTRSRCSSRLLEKEFRRRELQVKSVRMEQSPLLELLEIHYSHSQSNQKFRFQYLENLIPQDPEIMLVLVHYLHSLEQQNLQLQNPQQIPHYSLFKENLPTSLLRTILVLVHSRNSLVLRKQLLSIQTRSKCSSRLLAQEQKKLLREKSVRWTIQSIWRSRCPRQIRTHWRRNYLHQWQCTHYKVQRFCWIWIYSNSQWCCRIYYLQPRREANALLVCRNKRFRKNYSKRTWDTWRIYTSGNFRRSTSHLCRKIIWQCCCFWYFYCRQNSGIRWIWTPLWICKRRRSIRTCPICHIRYNQHKWKRSNSSRGIPTTTRLCLDNLIR